MSHVLEVLRVHVAGRPLVLFAAIAAVLVAASNRYGLSSRRNAWPAGASAFIWLMGSTALVVHIAVAAWYASDPHFFDNAEPTIPSVAWLFHVGRPIYPSPESPEQYAHVYGPMTFVLHGVVLALFGPSIGVSKWFSASAAASTLGIMYATIRQHATVRRSIGFVGLGSLLLLLFRNYSFWTRPEPLELALVSASLFFATTGRELVSAVLVGIVSGFLWNLKLTAACYSLPVLMIVRHRVGVVGSLIAVGTGTAVAAAPFICFTNVSLANYFAVLQLSARTGLLFSLLRENLEWASFLALPLLLSFCAVPVDRRPTGTEWRHTVTSLMFGVATVTIAAAKPGAGPYHLIPFIPLVVYLVSWQTEGFASAETCDPMVPRGAVAFMLTAAIIALLQQADFVRTMASRAKADEVADIQRFAGTHSGRVEMGYGQTEALSLERPILVFRNGAYLLDQPAIREYQLQGRPLPNATMDALRDCRIRYWLIPKGERPFSGANAYTAVLGKPLYPPDFRTLFEDTYQRIGVTNYYDVWRCRGVIDR